VEDLLSGLALELALPVPGLDGDLHGRPITSAARHLDPAHGLLVGKVARLERAPQMCAWASTIRTPGMVSRSSDKVKADAAWSLQPGAARAWQALCGGWPTRGASATITAPLSRAQEPGFARDPPE